MNLKVESPDKHCEEASDYRLLKFNEVVSQGDFVADGNQGFKLWDGPRGFRADSFLKTIYRRKSIRVPLRKR
jgi:hypothetical protein